MKEKLLLTITTICLLLLGCSKSDDIKPIEVNQNEEYGVPDDYRLCDIYPERFIFYKITDKSIAAKIYNTENKELLVDVADTMSIHNEHFGFGEYKELKPTEFMYNPIYIENSASGSQLFMMNMFDIVDFGGHYNCEYNKLFITNNSTNNIYKETIYSAFTNNTSLKTRVVQLKEWDKGFVIEKHRFRSLGIEFYPSYDYDFYTEDGVKHISKKGNKERGYLDYTSFNSEEGYKIILSDNKLHLLKLSVVQDRTDKLILKEFTEDVKLEVVSETVNLGILTAIYNVTLFSGKQETYTFHVNLNTMTVL